MRSFTAGTVALAIPGEANAPHDPPRDRLARRALAIAMTTFAHRAADLIGQTIDTYEIAEIVGRGGMGVVYRAVDTSLDRTVALKMMHGHLVEDERFLMRFSAEARALGRLQHPNIVNVYALRHVEPYLFLVMEYVDGGSLHELLERRGALPWPEALAIIRQALRGIAFAHGQQILHRDIKPRNLLLSRHGEVKLADLGLAKIQQDTSDSLGLTRTGVTGGTLHYMPPEQLEGLKHVDQRSDLYALGMTFYKMLAGQTPFDRIESDFQVQKAIEAHDVPPVSHFKPELPSGLVQIVSKATAHAPADRYQRAEEMLVALNAVEAAHLPEAPRKSTFPDPEDMPVLFFPEPDTTSPGAPGDPAHAPPADANTVGPDAPTVVAHPAGAVDERSPAPEDVPELPAGEPPGSDARPLSSLARSEPSQPDAAPDAPPSSPAPVALSTGNAPVPQVAPPALLRPRWRRPLVLGGGLGALAVLVLLLWPEPAQTTLSVETEPAGASVFLDGALIGPAPVAYPTTAGAHGLRVEKEGYVPLDTTVTLFPNTASLYVALTRTSAPVVITSEPAGAEVRLDGRLLGATPIRSLTLPTGPYRVVLRKHGYADHHTTLTVSTGRVSTVNAVLQTRSLSQLSLKSPVEITTTPPADIYVGGYLVARDTTRYVERLPRGTHAIRVEHPEYGSQEQEIEIQNFEPRTLTFDLHPPRDST